MDWRERLVKTYTTVPKTVREGVWRVGIAAMAISSILTGFTIWKNPRILMGIPSERMSIIEHFTGNDTLRRGVYTLMENYFFSNRPYGLMFVAWEELDSMVGLWVRPADQFPGKNGAHDLTPDMRVLGGPFLFGECASTESIAMPGRIMVACPVVNDYDIWGYVAAIVDDDPAEIERTQRRSSADIISHTATDGASTHAAGKCDCHDWAIHQRSPPSRFF